MASAIDPMPNDDSLPPNRTAAAEDRDWQALLAARDAHTALPTTNIELLALYGPLCATHQRGTVAFGHLAQSLDGRIATGNGHSRWLSGEQDLVHTHRMRALCDAVIVGANTVLHDNPQLTVRRCSGEHPVRVVIDPDRRLDGSQRVFRDGAAPTLLLAATDRARVGEKLGQAEIVTLARDASGMDPHAIRRTLALRGLRALFVEGGGVTVSRFLAAGALDRLQITIAPIILGSGRPGLQLPEISDIAKCLRPRSRRFTLGEDVMVECVFDE